MGTLCQIGKTCRAVFLRGYVHEPSPVRCWERDTHRRSPGGPWRALHAAPVLHWRAVTGRHPVTARSGFATQGDWRQCRQGLERWRCATGLGAPVG